MNNKRDKITQTTDVPQELVFVKYKLNTRGPYSVRYRGYEYSLLRDELTERDKLFLLCSICEGVMIEATMCGGKFSCDVCVPSGSDAIPVFPTRKTISELSSRCPLYLRGCKWVGTLATVLNHVEKCDYLFTACPLRCGDAMLQKNILEHVESNCNERIISCDLCDMPIVAKCLPEHLDLCPQFTIRCNECQENLFRKDLSDHNSNICLYRLVECRYAKYGCREKLVYVQLNQHILENTEVHITLLESSHKRLETKTRLPMSNIIKESNNRLYFAIFFPSYRQGNVTTHLINQTNIKDSIVFRNRELRCKPQFPFSLESKQSKPIPSYSVISTGLEGSLLQPPFLQGGVFILGIILTFS